MALEVPLHVPLAFELMKLRGFLTVATIGGFLVLADVVQRLIIGPLVWACPARKDRVFAVWLRGLASGIISGVRLVGGGQLGPLPTIPFAPGVLVLMNHQSLLDIPIVVQCVEGGYLRIVTRKRYARGVPAISRLIKLYDFPVVDPTGGMREQLKVLREAARDPRVPIVVYPERCGGYPSAASAVESVSGDRGWDFAVWSAQGHAQWSPDGRLPCECFRTFRHTY